MSDYGYKNISSRKEFEKASKKDGKIKYGPVGKQHLTNYDFIDWSTQGSWGMPGQTRYFVKSMEDLLKADQNVNKIITKKRNPKGYVGW